EALNSRPIRSGKVGKPDEPNRADPDCRVGRGRAIPKTYNALFPGEHVSISGSGVIMKGYRAEQRVTVVDECAARTGPIEKINGVRLRSGEYGRATCSGAVKKVY